ncbi:Uncharacterised protein [uncultured archaeon]|nr:Uncharacterised protein [uncultured archaeon]
MSKWLAVLGLLLVGATSSLAQGPATKDQVKASDYVEACLTGLKANSERNPDELGKDLAAMGMCYGYTLASLDTLYEGRVSITDKGDKYYITLIGGMPNSVDFLAGFLSFMMQEKQMDLTKVSAINAISFYLVKMDMATATLIERHAETQ